MLRVTFPDNTSLSCEFGAKIESVAGHFGDQKAGSELVAVRVNNEILPLSAPLEVNARLEPVTRDSAEGTVIYRRSLAFLLALSARALFSEERLSIGHSLGRSYYYTFADGKIPSGEEIEGLKNGMKVLVKKNLPIAFHYLAYAEAMEIFANNKQYETSLLLDQRSESKAPVNECNGWTDLYIAPLAPRTGLLTAFDLMQYQDGFLLRFPGTGKGDEIGEFEDHPVIFSVYREHKNWGRAIGVNVAGHLNKLVADRTVKDYIWVAEAFQAKKLAEIADKIYAKRDAVKAIFIAGPSSSGKTTTAKRLSLQLKALGVEPIAVSLDDYYINMDKTPRDENGQPDFECLEALDVPYLNEQLLSLFKGEEITLPVYDFKTGRRRESGGMSIRLREKSMLIVEGIHGLNDALTPLVDKNIKFKLYISALTQLNLDGHNRISTSDNRLVRRMVRDYQFRGTGAAKTIHMWSNVQRGEKKHIFPFQNFADAAFNSALDYELGTLKVYAEPLLRSIKPNLRCYAEAVRLRAFLENFAAIPPQYVPGQSILREFIGESEFKY
ncbi:MAG: nucleoside kinase [Treponema sp.]|jgi:uridine kinase|nr:nucleoside kinase [Treponema sp.]